MWQRRSNDVQEGDLVATRGELHTQMNTMSVQELMLKSQDLIPNTSLSPVACGLNVVMQEESPLEKRNAQRCKTFNNWQWFFSMGSIINILKCTLFF